MAFARNRDRKAGSKGCGIENPPRWPSFSCLVILLPLGAGVKSVTGLAQKIGSTSQKAPSHEACAHHEHDGPPVRTGPPARRFFEFLDEGGHFLGAHRLRRLHRALTTHPRDDAVDEIREAHGLFEIRQTLHDLAHRACGVAIRQKRGHGPNPVFSGACAFEFEPGARQILTVRLNARAPPRV